MANILTQSRKEKLDYLIKLDKAYVECHWDYDRDCEYKRTKSLNRNVKILNAIQKKTEQVWGQLMKSFKVERQWDLPREVHEYYENGRRNNCYDRFNNFERDLQRLGVKLPKQ